MNSARRVALFAAVFGLAAHASMAAGLPTIGQVKVLDPALQRIVAEDAQIEKVAGGITWAEGPAWIRQGAYLLFTDPKLNRMYRWSEREGLSVFLTPAGFGGADDGTLREPGANGLFVEDTGQVLLADSGSRAVARFNPQTRTKTVLAERFQGHRFNSPNDLVAGKDGAVFFTDPPYGLKGVDNSPVRELAYSGVYRLDADGSVHLLDNSLKYPNGIALSPDGRRLYVSDSDPAHPVWMVYMLDSRGAVTGKRVFADATDLVQAGRQGNPDGMCMAADGTLFTAAPGGLLVLDPDGTRLGLIETGNVVSNCTFGDDGRTLYMTSGSFIARVRVKVAGLTANGVAHHDVLDIHHLPLGDGRISSAPKQGYLMSCPRRGGPGGGARGKPTWIHGDTWDLSEKIHVQGRVTWPEAQFSISTTKDGRVVSRLLMGNGLPVDTPTGNFPVSRSDPAYRIDSNPNSIREHDNALTLPVEPRQAEDPSCVPMGMIGIALNGVAIFNAIDDQGRDAVAHEVQDLCNGHPQQRGEYHYHGPSPCLPGETANEQLIGYALDGFGIYSMYDAQGRELTNADLDACHGRVSEVEWNGRRESIYHYVLTREYPYTVGCFRGKPVSLPRPPRRM